ncbi:MAG: glycosyl hydrolase family 28-related protein [Pseudomonadota bacterium]
MKYFGLFSAIAGSLMLSTYLSADTDGSQTDLPDILSAATSQGSDYLPDFSYAGYANGSKNIPAATGKLVHVDDFGAIASDAKDDTKAVQKAIQHAHTVSGPVVVRFGAGRYRLTEVLKIQRANIVLQGQGSGGRGTTLFFPRPLKQVDKSTSLDELRKYLVQLNKRQVQPELNLNDYFSEYSWSGGFIWIQKPGVRPAPYLEEYDPPIDKLADVVSGARGSKQIEVSDHSRVKPGDIIQVQWINETGPDAPIVKALYGSQFKSAGSHHWNFPQRPLVRQTSRIASKDGKTLVLSDPLLHDANKSIPAQISSWDGLQQVGIEALHIEFPNAPYFGHHLEQGYNGIYFTSSFDSWVRNVRITNADSGILSYNSANLTYRNITTDGQRKAHYGIHMGNVHNVLAENVLVLNPVLHSLTFNTQSTKCVYKNAEVFQIPTLDQHAGANHQNLFDNVTLHTEAMATENGPVAVVFNGSGAPYWQPGHGGFNTTWNLRVLINGGAFPDEVVTIEGTDEGPMARIVGLHGNRTFKLDYRPAPYIEKLNTELRRAPSLYDFQLDNRLGKN